MGGEKEMCIRDRDEMGLFDADTYSELEASAEAASDGHDCDVYFLVVDSIGDTDQRQYAKDYYLANGLGSGSEPVSYTHLSHTLLQTGSQPTARSLCPAHLCATLPG